jgi:hypothetical protein
MNESKEIPIETNSLFYEMIDDKKMRRAAAKFKKDSNVSAIQNVDESIQSNISFAQGDNQSEQPTMTLDQIDPKHIGKAGLKQVEPIVELSEESRSIIESSLSKSEIDEKPSNHHDFGWLHLPEEEGEEYEIKDEAIAEMVDHSMKSTKGLVGQKQLISSRIQDIVETDSKRRNEQRELQTIKIFRQIEEFSVGTYKYENRQNDLVEEQKEVVKKYIPMFPHFYLKAKQEANNSPENFNLKQI